MTGPALPGGGVAASADPMYGARQPMVDTAA